MCEKLMGCGEIETSTKGIRNTSKMSSAIETSNEWQTVKSRRTAVPRGSAAYKPSGTGYVPPSLRAAAVETKPTSLCADDFPTLGGTPKTVSGAWGAKTSFAQKVNDMIAHEQRTDADKEAEREAAKEMEGWEVLSLCFNKERYRAYADYFAAGARLERLVTDAAITRCIPSSNSTPMKYSTDYDNLSEVDSEDDE